MTNSGQGKWVKDKVYVLPNREDCYIYKRPRSSVWQYYLSIPGEGEERKSTKIKGDNSDPEKGQKEALDFALNRKLEVMSRQKQGLKARRVKKMFDFMADFLNEEEKRVSPYVRDGYITQETFRIKKHHLSLLKKFYKNKSIKLEDLDYPKLYKYPEWRRIPDPTWNPTPPKTNHTISTELTTIKAYFAYLMRQGYLPREPDFMRVPRESLRNNRRDHLTSRQYIQTINTLRKWKNAKTPTTIQQYNRKVIYEALLIMSNSCMRIGELRKLKWYDIESNPNLSKQEQKQGHLISIRREISKTGEPRMVQSPTAKRFNALRELAGIPKDTKIPFPHIPPEYRNNYVLAKYRIKSDPLGQGTWDRIWLEIKELCADRYWNEKKISYYSMRHTGISLAVSRGVPMLQLARNAGTGIRYVEDVYYHHESESKQTWDTLMQNRVFHDRVREHKDDLLVDLEDFLDIER